MRSGLIDLTFVVPEADELCPPFISLDASDLAAEAMDSGGPKAEQLSRRIHDSGRDIDLVELLDEYVRSWDRADQPDAAKELADWLEMVAEGLRSDAERISLDLRPRFTPAPR